MSYYIDKGLDKIADKVFSSQRITVKEALMLYKKAPLGFLGMLADYVKNSKHGNKVYYIRNIHLEPSNICVYNCKFCSFSSKNSNSEWNYSITDIKKQLKNPVYKGIDEIHITGSCFAGNSLDYYSELIKTVKKTLPSVHIKAFSAVEIHYLSVKTGLSYKDILLKLKRVGLFALPGGGAEIFDNKIRNIICPDKVKSEQWLDIHRTAHKSNIASNATMLYGHIENFQQRVAHLELLRNLQDETKGFMAFIPLKFRNKNNKMTGIKETTLTEDLINIAISRIFLDNFEHIKAYWPMFGKQAASLTLEFGADDFDGTINNSTKIYSLAGAEETNPGINENEIIDIITSAGKIPIRRFN
ncbi:MAG: CofH family radical SAM protein [Bacteroidales bacterium]|nr:CofH family radical SAM protein [Bacteroidales bacterium]